MLLFSFTLAQPMGRGMGQGPRMQAQNMLNLTDEQQTQIDQLRLELQKEMTPLQTRMQNLRSEYKLMLIDEKNSESALKAQLNKIADLRTQMEIVKAKHQRKVRSLLTDEQKVKFDQRILSGRGKGMRGQGPGACGRQGRQRMQRHRF